MPAAHTKPVYVIDGARTPFLKAKSSLGPFSATDLALSASQALLSRQKLTETDIDEVILGCTMASSLEANIARLLGLRLGLPESTPAFTVQRNCGSGLQALDSARQRIQLQQANVILAGGTEAMSHAPLLFNRHWTQWMGKSLLVKSWWQRLKWLTEFRPHFLKPVVALRNGLSDSFVGLSMGQTAERLAKRFGVDRAQADAWSLNSHARLANAQDQKTLHEITPLFERNGTVYHQDDGLRRDVSAEKLSRLKAVFEPPFGDVTAGNSSQISDGAAMLLLASETAVKQHQLPVLGRIVDCTWAALDPAMMGLGPAYAISQLLTRQKLSLEQIDYWEINEAFSAQVLACTRALADEQFCVEYLGRMQAWGEIPHDRLNVDGGAIACGHPVGASGARIALHMLNVLKQKGARFGVASLCIGGGQGGAMLVESIAEAGVNA